MRQGISKALAPSGAVSLQIATGSVPAGNCKAATPRALLPPAVLPPYTWSSTSGHLPTGLTLNSSTGNTCCGGSFLVCNYSQGFQSGFEIRRILPWSCRQKSSVTTNATTGSLEITTTALPVQTVQTKYTANIAVTGGVPPYILSISGGNLPTGLTLSSSTGIIAGTPTLAGAFAFTIAAKDSTTGSVSTNFSLNISTSQAPTITGISPTSGSTAGGTPVTIAGSNFRTGAVVQFGGCSAASAQVVSPTLIQVLAPAGTQRKGERYRTKLRRPNRYRWQRVHVCESGRRWSHGVGRKRGRVCGIASA